MLLYSLVQQVFIECFQYVKNCAFSMLRIVVDTGTVEVAGRPVLTLQVPFRVNKSAAKERAE